MVTERVGKGSKRGSEELEYSVFLICFWEGKYIYNSSCRLMIYVFSSINDTYNLKIKSFFERKYSHVAIFIKDKVEFKVVFFLPQTLKINSRSSCIQHCLMTFNVTSILLPLRICLYILKLLEFSLIFLI